MIFFSKKSSSSLKLFDIYKNSFSILNMKDISMKLAETIALEHLCIETLQTRNRDSLDFHDCSVRGVYAAINAAYLAGKKAKKPVKKIKS